MKRSMGELHQAPRQERIGRSGGQGIAAKARILWDGVRYSRGMPTSRRSPSLSGLELNTGETPVLFNLTMCGPITFPNARPRFHCLGRVSSFFPNAMSVPARLTKRTIYETLRGISQQ